MGLGWLDAIAPAALSLSSGVQSGNLQAEEEKRRQAQEVLRNALLQAQIEKTQQPDPWQPTTIEQYREFHPPEVPETPEQVRAKAQAEHPERFLTPDQIGARARAEHPDRFRPPQPSASDVTRQDRTASEEAEGLAILNVRNDPKIVGPFGAAYKAVRDANPQMKPGIVATRAMAALKTSRPDLFRKEGGFLDTYLSGQSAPEPVVTPEEIPATAPTAPTGGQRVVTQDQADFLKAKGAWDDSKYRVQ